MKFSILAIALLGALGSTAQAETVFDFENAAGGPTTSLSQTVDGITVSISGPASFDVANTGYAPFGSRSIITYDQQVAAPYVANFSEAVTNVAISAGDFGSDADTVFFEAFSGLDASGALLASMTSDICCDGPVFSDITVALTATGIRSVRFFTGPTDRFPGSLFFDNLRVNTTAAVPEPASWGMMIGGFALAGAAMRRRPTALLA